MKKQILAGVLSATMVVGMGGVSVFAADNADDKTYNIGICQLVQHEALDAATQGFKDAITEELGDKVTFDEQNAQGDSTFPVHLTLLHWISRQQCSTNCSRMQRMSDLFTAPQKQTPSTR